MDHESVTDLTRTCQLGVTADKRSVSGAGGPTTSAKRLEDVEKFVRSHDREIDALLVALTEALDRIEELERVAGQRREWQCTLDVVEHQ